MNKKGVAAGIVLVVLALFLFALFLINIASRECNSNSDCKDTEYCSTDYRCYQFPDRVVVDEGTSFMGAAFILGVAIIIAAIILRYKKEKK